MARPAAAVVVLYNTACSDSPTCKALAQTDLPVQVLIYDNSTRDMGNKAQCQDLGWTYLGGNGNMGLSKAYNACIDYLTGRNFDGFVCLFDDDTELTPAYFQALAREEGTGKQLLVPLIYADDRLLSPCRITPAHKSILFPDEKTAMAYTGEDFSAINSAMAMDIALFRDYRYDENIFLDGIDHTHMQKMIARGIQPGVLDVRFDHHFSGDERPSKASAVTRFTLFTGDYAYIFRDHPSRYLFLTGKRAFRLTLQYKSFVFLKILLQARSRQRNRRKNENKQ
jgi:glycosyltransferase involved in cell wall biosynthesis